MLLNIEQTLICTLTKEVYLLDVSNELEIGIIELLEHHWISALVGMTLEGAFPERLLYLLPVWVQTTKLLDSQDRAELSKFSV